jgi:hypothetical protein
VVYIEQKEDLDTLPYILMYGKQKGFRAVPDLADIRLLLFGELF